MNKLVETACGIIALILVFMALDARSGELPDQRLTPGVARSVTLKELCTTSTKLVRNVPESEKKAVYKEYGQIGNDRSKCAEGQEIDHLISLEIAGSNDIKNLWPQSFCGTNNARDKDKLENELHRRICSGKMTIQQAQSCISTNWISCYKDIFK